MERTFKTWGEKSNIFQNDLCEVSILRLKPKKRCSWHNHKAKYNLFYVIDGKIWIKVEDGTILVEKGQIFTVNPGEWHEFHTGIDPALAIEVMFVEYDAGDIERAELGGDMGESVMKRKDACYDYQKSKNGDYCGNCGFLEEAHYRDI